jgi:tRNA nucleotidyltransferase/poly(A) polymerase
MFQFAEVGGAVRDKFLGLESKDVDFVAVPTQQFDTAENAFISLSNHLKEKKFKVFLETPQFFTIRAQVPDDHPLKERTNVADFVLARKDSKNSDGRRPDFVLPGTLMDDLERRDFTINAMAIMDGKLIDPFGGRDDINNRLLKFVGDPHERIKEDGLRVMRALRFSITKGFDIDSDAWNVINSAFGAAMLRKVSTERIRDELEKMFMHDSFSSMKILLELNEPFRWDIFGRGIRLMPTLKK